ncbi:MAG TPA: hypothetical protein VFL93_11630 [Longimicrobiaceae bacterium]|nr:hypothetical protein [Longimicrobiaceae bacterium]
MRQNRNSPARRPQRALHLAAAAGLLLAALPLLLSGCHEAPNAPDVTETGGVGWLKATVRNAADATADTAAQASDTTARITFKGSGEFGVHPDPSMGVDITFQLSADATDAGGGRDIFLLGRPGNGRPAPGRRALAPLTRQGSQYSGFTAYYSRTTPQLSEGYTALSGSVTIRKSTSEEVDGTFEVTMVQTSRSAPADMEHDWDVGPNTIMPGAKRIEVTGSFHAGPAVTTATIDIGHAKP